MTRTVWAWVKVLGGAGIVALLLWRLGTGAVLDGLRRVDSGALLAACGIGLLTTVFSAWRWCLVARGLGIRLPLGGAVADYYRALFLNAALPGGVLGDVHRAVRHGRDVGDVGRGVRTVVLERSAGQVVVVTLGVAMLLVLPSPVLAQAHPLVLAQVAAVVVAVGGLAFGLVAWTRRRRGTSLWARIVRTGVSDVRLGLLARANWPGIVISSALVLAGHLATFYVAARAAGSSASIARLAPLMLLALLAMLLPLNIGGWGPREGVAAWAFGAAGLSATMGLTVAVIYGLLAFVASLPGAGVLLVRWIARLRGDRARVDPEPEPAQIEASQPAETASAGDGIRTLIRRRTLRTAVGRTGFSGAARLQRAVNRRAAGTAVAVDRILRPKPVERYLVSQAAPNRSDSA